MEQAIQQLESPKQTMDSVRDKPEEVTSSASQKIPRAVLWRRFKEKAIHYFFFVNGIIAVIILVGIFSLLFTQGFPALKAIGVGEFFLSDRWDPTSPVKESYGILAMVVSTLMVTFGALIIAVPVGIACAAYLADVASPRMREIVKPVIEILAGIPSVVVGFLGIVVTGPFIAKFFRTANGLNAVNG